MLGIINAFSALAGEGAAGTPGTDFYFVKAHTPQRGVEMIVEMVCRRIPARFGYHPVDDVQVITPMHRGDLGAGNLNQVLQEALNPASGGPEVERFGWTFRPGDRVIARKAHIAFHSGVEPVPFPFVSTLPELAAYAVVAVAK